MSAGEQAPNGRLAYQCPFGVFVTALIVFASIMIMAHHTTT
jgi:hypothetical protein